MRVVDLGPFKHRVDDGLDVRKAAFEAMDVLLETIPHTDLDLPSFVACLRAGLADHVDVKLPVLLTLARLAGGAPGPLLPELDSIAPLLDAVITAKVKASAVKQDVDRNEDMVRSALRAADALARVPGADDARCFSAWLAEIEAGPAGPKLAAVRAEREAEATGGPGAAAAGGEGVKSMDTT